MNRSDVHAMLAECLCSLRADYPTASLFDVQVRFGLCERDDSIQDDWHTVHWQVQVGNEHGSGDTPKSAIEDLRQQVASKALVPGAAERVAAILSELPEAGFTRDEVTQVARDMLRRRR